MDGTDETVLMKQLYEYYGAQVQDLNRTITELQVELAKYKGADTTKAAAKDSSEVR